MPRAAPANPTANLAGDHCDRILMAAKMHCDVDVRGTGLRLAIGMADIALVLGQQALRLELRAAGGADS